MSKQLKEASRSLKPTLTTVDIVFSKRNFLKKIIKICGSTMYTHKIKTIVVILGLYAAHKSFGLYKSVKSALNPLADLQSFGEDGEQD